jgi:hypothetical protein
LIRRLAAGCTLACAAAPPVLIVTSWAVAGSLQRGSYDPVRQTISVLAGHAAADRWIVTASLVGVGLCYLATAAGMDGLRRRARFGLVVAGGAALGVAASPQPADGTTARHAAFAALGAVAITVWPLLAARSDPPVAVVGMRVSVAVTVAFLALGGWLLAETQGGTMLGLAERISTSVKVCWPFVVAVSLHRVQGERWPQRSAAGVGQPRARVLRDAQRGGDLFQAAPFGVDAQEDGHQSGGNHEGTADDERLGRIGHLARRDELGEQ